MDAAVRQEQEELLELYTRALGPSFAPSLRDPLEQTAAGRDD
jgi:hypothetical protein